MEQNVISESKEPENTSTDAARLRREKVVHGTAGELALGDAEERVRRGVRVDHPPLEVGDRIAWLVASTIP